MSSSKIATGVFVLSSLVAVPAFAQEATVLVPVGEAPVRFTGLAADGLESELDVQIGLHQIDDLDGTLTTFRVGGQFVTPQGFGGYLGFNSTYVTEDDEGEDDDDEFGAGNIEVGGLYRLSTADPRLALTFRAGLTLPTADEEDEGALLNYLGMLRARASDAISALPEVTALRVGFAPTFRTGNVFLRGDVGFDIPIDQPENEFTDELDPTYHVDLAAGIRGGAFAGTAALTTFGATGSNTDGHIHAFSLGGQYDAGAVTPHATFLIPFTSGMDEESGEFIDEILDGYVFLVGASIALQ